MIIDVYWTPKINMMIVQCWCGRQIRSPMNRWKVICKHCHRFSWTEDLRNDFIKRISKYDKIQKPKTD